MKIMILFLTFSFLLNQSALAMEVWVTTPEVVSPEKMLTLIHDLPRELKDQDVTSFMDHEFKNPLKLDSREKLENLISQATDEESKHNLGLAIQVNEKLLQELEKYPNVGGLQAITQSCFLKLAQLYQMTKDQNKADSFWKKAYAWNPKAELNEELYPPSVIQKFRKFLPHDTLTTLKVRAPKYSLIFLNGKKINSTDGTAEVLIYPGKHQIAVLAPGSFWQVENLRLNKASNKPLVYGFKSKSVVSGTCENPQVGALKLPAQTRLLVVFEKENCNRVFDAGTWYSIEGRPVAHENPSVKMLTQMDLKTESWFTKVTKSPWFWVGLGVAGIGTLAVMKNQPVAAAVPTETHSMR